MFPFRYGRRNSCGTPTRGVVTGGVPSSLFSCLLIRVLCVLDRGREHVVVRLRVVIVVEGLCDKPSAY